MIVLVTVWSDGVTQVSDTVDPPRTACSRFISDAGEVTGWLFTLVITSPAISWASAAGVLHSEPITRVPERTGAILVGTPASWLLCRQVLGAGLGCPRFWALATCWRS